MKEPPRFLRLLLHLYPRGHRREYGSEMWELVRYRFRTTRRSRWLVVAWTVSDLTWNAARVWIDGAARRMTGMGHGWSMDLRFVVRSLRRRWGYAGTTILVVAGAVAVNVAVLSFVRGTLLAEPTYPDAGRVVVGWGSNVADGQLRDVVSGPNYIEMRERVTSLDHLAAFHPGGRTLMEDGRARTIDVHEVSVDFFDVVPVTPFMGRIFGLQDRTTGGPRHVIATYDFWRDRLGGDPGAVGSTLPLDGEPHTVIGVLPEDFQFLMPTGLYVPLGDDLLAADGRYRIHYHLVGRLRRGATPGQATRELTSILGEITREHPRYEGWSILVERLDKVSVTAVRPVLWILTAAMGVVFLVALVNLTTLFRIRIHARAQELSVRRALGGGRLRIARVLALESVGLALAGAVAGVTLAPPLLEAIRGMVPVWIPIPESAAMVPALQARMDPRVVAFALLTAVVGALVLSLPALAGASRKNRGARDGRGGFVSRGTRWLVVAELALATVLCLGAGLTTRSAARLLEVDVGLEDRGLLTLYFGDVWDRPIPDQVAYFREVVRQVESLPQVQSAALIDYVPFQQEDDYARIHFLNRAFEPVRDLREEWRRVSHGLFATAGMRVVQGRSMTADEFRGTPRTAVVNEAFADKHYPDGDAVGQYLSTHDESYQNLEIVGVVADVRSYGPAEPAPPMLYVPLQGSPRGSTGMYVRSAGPSPGTLGEAVREAIWSVDPSEPVEGVVPMTDLVAAWVAIPRAVRTLVTGVAALALLLAAVGVFGVVAFTVRRRTREFGVRMALGASPRRLARDVMSGATPLVVAGLGAGLVLGVLAAWAAGAVLFGVEPLDPVSVLWAVGVMGAAALLATYVPARKAATVDPTEAMRVE